MPEPRWLFADLDGTLGDSLPVAYETYRQFAEDSGFSPTRDEFDSLNGPSLPEIVAILRERYGLSPEALHLERRYRELWAKALANVLPMPGASELLEATLRRSMRVAVVTSGGSAYAQGFLERSGLATRVAMVVTGEDVRRSKPDPAIYSLALERTGSKAHEVLALEDSVNGVSSAVAAGIRTVGFAAPGPYGSRAEALLGAGASRVIDRLPLLFAPPDQR